MGPAVSRSPKSLPSGVLWDYPGTGIGDVIRFIVRRVPDLLDVARVCDVEAGVVLVYDESVSGRTRRKASERLLSCDPRLSHVVCIDPSEAGMVVKSLGMPDDFAPPSGTDDPLTVVPYALRAWNRRLRDSRRVVVPYAHTGLHVPSEYEGYVREFQSWACGRPLAVLAPFGRTHLDGHAWLDITEGLLGAGWAVVWLGGGVMDLSDPQYYARTVAARAAGALHPGLVTHVDQKNDIFRAIAALDAADVRVSAETWTHLGCTLWDRNNVTLAVARNGYPDTAEGREGLLNFLTLQHDDSLNLHCTDRLVSDDDILSWVLAAPLGEGPRDTRDSRSLIIPFKEHAE
jgi:hypothetical protein